MSVVTGVSISTLRYYDKEKILTPAVRNEKSGYRYYSAKQLDLLHCIKFLQSFGFTLEDIRAFLDNHDYDWMEKTMEDFRTEPYLKFEGCRNQCAPTTAEEWREISKLWDK